MGDPIGLVRITGTVPCDHEKCGVNCDTGLIIVRGTRFTCPRCNGTGQRPVYEATGRAITIQGVNPRVMSRSEVLGDA